jgi:hypothetical protein
MEQRHSPNVVTNLLNPTALLAAVTSQICSALTSVWQSTLGNKQCGITLTGFKIGFLGGLGGGLSCPKLSFGGGGPALGSIGIGANNNGRLYVTGNAPSLPPAIPAPPQRLSITHRAARSAMPIPWRQETGQAPQLAAKSQ